MQTYHAAFLKTAPAGDFRRAAGLNHRNRQGSAIQPSRQLRLLRCACHQEASQVAAITSPTRILPTSVMPVLVVAFIRMLNE
jgi:hypothetical protein